MAKEQETIEPEILKELKKEYEENDEIKNIN